MADAAAGPTAVASYARGCDGHDAKQPEAFFIGDGCDVLVVDDAVLNGLHTDRRRSGKGYGAGSRTSNDVYGEDWAFGVSAACDAEQAEVLDWCEVNDEVDGEKDMCKALHVLDGLNLDGDNGAFELPTAAKGQDEDEVKDWYEALVQRADELSLRADVIVRAGCTSPSGWRADVWLVRYEVAAEDQAGDVEGADMLGGYYAFAQEGEAAAEAAGGGGGEKKK